MATYFASDFHLGVDARLSSAEREKQIVRWLDQIADKADAIYLVGDLFDFWFEYATVVPKGYTRLLGQLAALRDAGIPIYFFTGNHDMWMFGYFQQELGIPIYRSPIIREIDGKKYFIGHGDGLGPGDYGYKFIKQVFANPLSQWMFARLHPNVGIRLAQYFSGSSRQSNPSPQVFLGEEQEWLAVYAQQKIEQIPDIDYFIFGHRHLPIDFLLRNGRSRYLNLGEWLYHNSYVVAEQGQVQHLFFENQQGRVFGRQTG